MRNTWKSFSGRAVADVAREVRSILGDEDRVIHIGTDGLHRGTQTNYVTVIAVLTPGRGGRLFYQRMQTTHTPSLAQRLFKETELSVSVALALNESVPQDIVIHVDANEDLRHRSSKYVQALAGMVVGHGFQCRVKPHSWCATHVADYLLKDKHLKSA